MQPVEQLANTPGFLDLREQIIALARLSPNDRALDIGAGTGLLTLAAAPTVSHVTALDISPAMCRHLQTKLASLQLHNVDVIAADTINLPLADESVDVALSNYCLHHLSDADKRQALREIWRVLRPGGRVVIGDMMFQLALANARDRALLARFAKQMLRTGPAGLVRLLKNVVRVITGRAEHPASVDWWQQALQDTGFTEVTVRALHHEGGIAHARRPQ